MECNICYYPIEEQSILCSNVECTSCICNECISRCINIFYKDANYNVIKCPNKNCLNGEYLYSDIKKVCSKEILNKFEIICFNYLKNDNFGNIVIDSTQKKIIKQIRKERHDFILNEYPISISEIINISLIPKLNKINKKNVKYIENVITKSNKKCFNIFCNGILDKNYICLYCNDKFCKKCEINIIENTNHICKQEDIDNITFVNSLVKCPTCKLPVIRSFGCNHITCSQCNTNFDYTTGQLCKAGNHSNAILTLRTNYKPSNIYIENKKNKQNTDNIKLLVDIENKEPSIYSFNNILNIFKKFKKESDENLNSDVLDKYKTKISIEYEKYKMSHFKQQIYFKYLIYIQKKIESNDLKQNELYKIFEKIENF